MARGSRKRAASPASSPRWRRPGRPVSLAGEHPGISARFDSRPPAEIQAALAPTATIGPGVPATDMAPVGVSCSYTWGSRTPQWGAAEAGGEQAVAAAWRAASW